jgi:macrolide-specific efflux system membrane fusion protein
MVKKMQVLSMEISSRIEKAVYILILPFLILSLSGCYFFPQEEEVLAPPLKAPEKVTYRTIKVEKGNIEKRVNATAYFVSDNQTDLSFKHRGGRIESINVKTGDMVEAGDTLIQLETDNLETQLLQQEIALEKLILNYNQSLSNAERSIKLANFELEELEKKLEKLKNTIENIPKEVSVQDVMPDAIDNLELLEERIKRQELEVEGEIVKYNNIKDMMELDIKTAEIQIENLQTELEILPISSMGSIVPFTFEDKVATIMAVLLFMHFLIESGSISPKLFP